MTRKTPFEAWVEQNRERIPAMTKEEILAEFNLPVSKSRFNFYLHKHGLKCKSHRYPCGDWRKILTRENFKNIAVTEQSGPLSTPCWIWKGARHPFTDYGVISDNGKKMAHRFTYELFNGPINDGLHVLHECDNPPCCNPAHLKTGTQIENAGDRTRRDRQQCYVLDFNKATTIRELYAAGESLLSIAAQFGVTGRTVWDIVKNRRYTQPKKAPAA